MLFAWLAASSAGAKDVTAQVVRETDLDERLVAVCRAYCLGNRAGATLNQVTVVRATGTSYRVAGRASLRNHQFVEPANVFGAQVGGFDLFYYVVTIDAVGTLDGQTCRLRVDRVQVLDDRIGLTDVARKEEGKVYLVPDCQRFLAGL
ncbi:MAG: hypothetical protein FJX64_09845 [Alphaproteobacteria bacterium]|nr:hypothetical protein [Alphaproteobacteria bacterium]